MIADIIDDKMEFRHQSVITLTTRRIQDYEYKTLIKKIGEKIEMINSNSKKKIKISQSNYNIYGRLLYKYKKGVLYSTAF